MFVGLLTLGCALGDGKYRSLVSLLRLTVSHHWLQCEISVAADSLGFWPGTNSNQRKLIIFREVRHVINI